MTDEEARALLAATAAGDTRALEALYGEFAGAVKSFVLHMLPGAMRDFADDVVSQTFVACWQSAGRYEGRAQFKTWILGIARFKTLELVRGDARHVVAQDADDTEEPVDETPLADVVKWMEGKEIAAALDHCFSKLSEALRLTVYLAHVEDMGLPDIAAALSISRETAKSRMRLAMPRLRECLAVRLELHHST